MIIDKKLPMLVDVRDESTDDVRIVLELKPGADPDLVMAYLFKHTPLRDELPRQPDLPGADREPGGRGPAAARSRGDAARLPRLPLGDGHAGASSSSWPSSKRRIHILEGFAKIFDALDEAIRIIRKSEGKADAAEKLIEALQAVDDVQTDAILELKLYKLARLEIQVDPRGAEGEARDAPRRSRRSSPTSAS